MSVTALASRRTHKTQTLKRKGRKHNTTNTDLPQRAPPEVQLAETRKQVQGANCRWNVEQRFATGTFVGMLDAFDLDPQTGDVAERHHQIHQQHQLVFVDGANGTATRGAGKGGSHGGVAVREGTDVGLLEPTADERQVLDLQ